MITFSSALMTIKVYVCAYNQSHTIQTSGLWDNVTFPTTRKNKKGHHFWKINELRPVLPGIWIRGSSRYHAHNSCEKRRKIFSEHIHAATWMSDYVSPSNECLFNPLSAGTVFNYMSESEICRRQHKDGPRTEKIKIFLMAVDLKHRYSN